MEVNELKTPKGAVRIKANETFSVRISVPQCDCPCGCEWGELQVVKTTYTDGTVYRCIRCPKCGKQGPRTETAFEAGLAWGGMLSREERKER